MRKIFLCFLSVLMLLLGNVCYCQNVADEYMKNPSLALKDAKVSFSRGDYESCVKQVTIYQSLTDNKDADQLLSDAQQCLHYLEEAIRLEKRGDHNAMIQCYKSILLVNPGDNTAKDMVKKNPTKGIINGHKYVDLGLSVKWATCNVGATRPSEYGNYYAWGETSPKAEYLWENYKYYLKCPSNYRAWVSKYLDTKNGQFGRVDNKGRLELSDDAAYANWGDGWRMPTLKEMEELISSCKVSWVERDGVLGLLFTSKINGNSVFFPAGGYYDYHEDIQYKGTHGFYWTSSASFPLDGHNMSFGRYEATKTYGPQCSGYWRDRCQGHTIRPVAE